VPPERRQLVVRVEPELADRITEARGDVPLQRWLIRAILEKLGEPTKQDDDSEGNA
jgi:hypothetical protein